MVRRSLVLGCLWALLAAAHADGLAPREERAVQAVVGAQLGAFARGDAKSAFGYATPTIRAQFGDAATFMAMVRQGYPMVISPTAISYMRARAEAGSVWQDVLLRDREGQGWLATYELVRQPDRRWRINGCTVQPDDGKSST